MCDVNQPIWIDKNGWVQVGKRKYLGDNLGCQTEIKLMIMKQPESLQVNLWDFLRWVTLPKQTKSCFWTWCCVKQKYNPGIWLNCKPHWMPLNRTRFDWRIAREESTRHPKMWHFQKLMNLVVLLYDYYTGKIYTTFRKLTKWKWTFFLSHPGLNSFSPTLNFSSFKTKLTCTCLSLPFCQITNVIYLLRFKFLLLHAFFSGRIRRLNWYQLFFNCIKFQTSFTVRQ